MHTARLTRSATLLGRNSLKMSRMTSRSASSATLPVSTLLNAMEASALQSSGSAVFVDGSYHQNARSGHEEYLQEHIPGARHFDLDSVCDMDTALPHMMPSEQRWTAAMDGFGISADDHVVVYTHKDAVSGPRVWYLFKAFGHARVSLLDGGIEGWKCGNNAVSSASTDSPPTFQKTEGGGYQGAKLNTKMVASKADVQQAMETGIAQILDARSEARFRGAVPEPRAGLVSGSIPGSLSLPYSELCADGDSTTFASREHIRDKLRDSGVIFGSKCVSTCGSGVTACYALVGMELMGKPLEDMPIYDGSWTEWGAEGTDTPKMTSADW